MAGNFTRDAFPAGCDVAVMASNLPQYDTAIIAEVVARTFAALLPGGEMLDDDGAGPIGPALWGLSEALFHSTGGAHTEAECLGYFRAAGFVDLAVKPFVLAGSRGSPAASPVEQCHTDVYELALSYTSVSHMRTNIEIDDKLMRQALKTSGLKTKREVVDAALRQFVRTGDQRRAIERLRGIGWEGDLVAWRRDKPTR